MVDVKCMEKSEIHDIAVRLATHVQNRSSRKITSADIAEFFGNYLIAERAMSKLSGDKEFLDSVHSEADSLLPVERR